METEDIRIPCHILQKNRVSPRDVGELSCRTIYGIVEAVTDAAESLTYIENTLRLITIFNTNKIQQKLTQQYTMKIYHSFQQ